MSSRLQELLVVVFGTSGMWKLYVIGKIMLKQNIVYFKIKYITNIKEGIGALTWLCIKTVLLAYRFGVDKPRYRNFILNSQSLQ